MFQNGRAICLSLATLFVGPSSFRNSFAQEIGFSERYALAENRESALAELIPGTETYFYYHCLHCQTVGKIPEARGHLDAWIAKVGVNEQTLRMQTRQFILEYKTNPQATLNHLKREFGINTEHPAPRKDEAAELETKLDPNVLNWSVMLQNYASNLGSIENIALGHATSFLNEQSNLRSWLVRIDRPDVPGLVDLLVREFKMNDSKGFGFFPIHNQLTVAQLLELQQKIPKLIESNAFVQARLRRIRPNDDQSIDDPAILREHLVALEDFAKTLPESQNSLKALILFHRLQFDERNGNMNRERFIQYIALPNKRPFASAEYVAKQSGRPQVNLGVNLQSESLLPPIGDDSSLVRRYLEHFFLTDTNVDGFSPYIDRDFLRKVFASAKILYGIGDSKTYYAQLSPDEQRELQTRIEINFPTNNPSYFNPSDSVRLTLDLKNVPELLIKIYRINARNVLVQQKQPIGTSIDLDGLIANIEKRIAYAQPADRRHREILDLPELSGGGVWVVDVLASGLRSRTLVNKGHLHAIQSASSAGDVFRVFDAGGKHVPTAKAIFGTREFGTEEDGNIVIPFGREVQLDNIILFDGPVASVQQFVHRSEVYQLQAGFLADPQSLLAGAQATVVVRPNLTCNGQPVTLAQLEKPKLTVTSMDLDGISATQTFSDIQLADTNELTKKFLVPQRLASITFSLSGEVIRLSNDSRVPVSSSHTITLNESARTVKIHDFYLTQTDRGYLLEVRGRNGEPAGRLPVQLEFKLLGLGPTVSIRLATNEKGIVDLGALANVERFKATADSIGFRDFNLSMPAPNWPASYHGLSNTPLEVAMSVVAGTEPIVCSPKGNEKAPGRFSLLEYRTGIVAANLSDKLSVEQGLIKIAGLEPGSYRLTDHASGRIMQIAIVKGELQGEHVVGQQKILEANRVRSVYVQEVKVEADKIQIQVGNNDRFTRIHLIANAFRPVVGHGTSLPAPDLPLSSAPRMRIQSFYINSLKLDEEYQYVLLRQFGKKFLGSLLPQPSAILNPWELAVTQNASKEAAKGDPMASVTQKLGESNAPARAANEGGVAPANGLPDYEFLTRGSLILANGKCDEAGKLSIDRKLLEGLTSVTIIVEHPTGTSFRIVVLPNEPDRIYTDRRLASSFRSTDNLTEVQGVKILIGSDKHDLGDATSTRAKLYSSIADVYQLYKTLLPNQPNFDKFECLTRWAKLNDVQKEGFYSDLACHEMNLFVLLHDKPFFDRVVRPYLANKMQKQFMDDYVLDADLATYVRPWKLSQLNAVERVLLAKRLKSQSSITQRWMGDVVSAIPTNSAAQVTRFSTGLMSGMLGDLDNSLDGVQNGVFLGRQLMELRDGESKGALGGMGSGGPGGGGGFGGSGGRGARRLEASDKLGEMDFQSKKDQEWSDGKEGDGKESGEKQRDAKSFGAIRYNKAKISRLYESLESTRKWAESNYFRLPIQNQNANLIPASKFWLDFLNHAGDAPFLSENIDMAANNPHEALLALGVLGLPLDSEAVEISVESGRVVATGVKNSIAFVQGIQKVEPSPGPPSVLASQNIFLAHDPAETAKPVQDRSLIKGTVYRLRVVLTNPSAIMVEINVLQQIPQGAIALENAKVVAGQKLDLAPFATQELTTKFYFPAAGDFTHYGAQITIDGKLAIAAPSTSLKVLDNPDSVDETSWSYIASWGSDEQVLEYLKKANLAKTELESIAWRLANRKFYDACLARLTDYGIFNATLWAYSAKHNDASRLREYLEKMDTVVNRVGASLNSDIMQVEPVDRLAFEHLDFRPLVVARTHQLGAKRVILNDGLAAQYERMMVNVSHQKTIDVEQRLALVYYLLLQNRTEESISNFAKIDPNMLDSKLQYDYFAAYLDMLQGKFEEADTISQKYVSYPNPRWRDWFGQIRSQVADRKTLQAGKSTDMAAREEWKTDSANRILSGAREQQNVSASETLPVLDLIQDGDKIVMRYRNLANVEINFYLMDVELLFSRNPFAQQDGGRLNSIDPNFSEKRQLVAARSISDAVLNIPEKLKNKNLVIEVTGGGLTRNLVVYANSLAVNVSPNTGRLQVMTKRGLQPLEGAYVKVYARSQDGSAKFYKDGYTDLRGQFDYTSLSTNELDTTTRFSLLVLHPEQGAIVRETDPPKR